MKTYVSITHRYGSTIAEDFLRITGIQSFQSLIGTVQRDFTALLADKDIRFQSLIGTVQRKNKNIHYRRSH